MTDIFTLPDLPWDRNALAPAISGETLDFHYGKHHAAYVTKLNAAVDGTDWASKSLEDIIKGTAGNPELAGLFNNAAQIWNHTFYWQSMRPGGGGKPSGDILAKIEQAFDGWDSFAGKFTNTASTLFGSGWVWLVESSDKLEIVSTSNAATPITDGKTPLITIDVWEHAYYVDYRNKRPDYVQAFMQNLVNWDFAAENLAGS
ncbi:MAG: superoxide dismutase [Planctomycetota bacterium]|jgi:Fe-Mn family superoxide dismutase